MDKPLTKSLLKELEDFVIHAENNDETLDASISRLKEILERTLKKAVSL